MCSGGRTHSSSSPCSNLTRSACKSCKVDSSWPGWVFLSGSIVKGFSKVPSRNRRASVVELAISKGADDGVAEACQLDPVHCEWVLGRSSPRERRFGDRSGE